MLRADFKKNRDEISPRPARALYVHVPFCRAKCRYCDFYSRPIDDDAARAYLDALSWELHSQTEHLQTPLASIYVGGGTPTALGCERLGTLLSRLRPLADAQTEFTVEANPGGLGAEIADVLAAGGANRVTVGVQSFRRAELVLLGRAHGGHDAAKAVAAVRAAGIANIGLDLIYGIPNQTVATWSHSLAAAIDLRPEHLSCYGLSVEPGTPLWADRQSGTIHEMPDLEQKACYEAAIHACRLAALEHYEISNFARRSRRCRHNLTYWRNEPYVGLGPAGASYVGGVRRTNLPDLASYVAACGQGVAPPATRERLRGRAAMAEAAILALRLTEGLDRKEFTSRYGTDPVAAFPRTVRRYRDIEALEVTSTHVRIAAEALFTADTILADILAEV